MITKTVSSVVFSVSVCHGVCCVMLIIETSMVGLSKVREGMLDPRDPKLGPCPETPYCPEIPSVALHKPPQLLRIASYASAHVKHKLAWAEGQVRSFGILQNCWGGRHRTLMSLPASVTNCNKRKWVELKLKEGGAGHTEKPGRGAGRGSSLTISSKNSKVLCSCFQ